MNLFSKCSITSVALSLLLFGLNWIIPGYSELIALIGTLFLIIGVVSSFIAIAKKEAGSTKFISLVSFFIVLFLITFFEPFQVIRIVTWLKNIV